MFTAMFHSRLPIELCELIIDRVRDPQALPWWARLQLVFQIRWHAGSPSDLERAHLHTLRACALTCSSWLPRARANLFHTAVFEDQKDVDRFVCSIAENRLLADLVRELVVDFAGGYVPFAQGSLVRNVCGRWSSRSSASAHGTALHDTSCSSRDSHSQSSCST